MDHSLKEAWSKSLRWIQEVPEGVERGNTVEAKLTPEGVKRMCEIGHAEKTTAAEVQSTVNVFPVEERAKERERVIKHTKPFNERYGRDTLLGLKLLRAKDLVGTVHDGKYCITLDFSAWFDQHLIAEKVRPWFCFFFQGQWYRLCRLPMGMRQAVDIADTATRIIASFPVPAGVRVDTYVDNIRFLGNCRDDVIAAATEFVRRSHKVGATINEVSPILGVDVSRIREMLTKLVVTEGEFLGIHFDYVNKLVKVGTKALVKLVALKEVFDHGECTYRNLLAIFGVMFFALQATGGARVSSVLRSERILRRLAVASEGPRETRVSLEMLPVTPFAHQEVDRGSAPQHASDGRAEGCRIRGGVHHRGRRVAVGLGRDPRQPAHRFHQDVE